MAGTRARGGRRLTRLQVESTEGLTPHMVRVVAGEPGFATFIANEYSDRHVKAVLRKPDVD